MYFNTLVKQTTALYSQGPQILLSQLAVPATPHINTHICLQGYNICFLSTDFQLQLTKNVIFSYPHITILSERERSFINPLNSLHGVKAPNMPNRARPLGTFSHCLVVWVTHPIVLLRSFLFSVSTFQKEFAISSYLGFFQCLIHKSTISLSTLLLLL